MIPEKMTSTLNVYNTISNKVDPIKSQVMESRMSYLETIKEESELRRTRFYRSNLAQIYGQASPPNPLSVQNSTTLDPV
jgi:hypothetical protein